MFPSFLGYCIMILDRQMNIYEDGDYNFQQQHEATMWVWDSLGNRYFCIALNISRYFPVQEGYVLLDT